MTSKEVIIKYFCEMDIEMLEMVLDDGRTYNDARMEVFLKKVDEVFDKFREGGDSELIVYNGAYRSEFLFNEGDICYTFVGNKSRNYINLIFDERNIDVYDIYQCEEFNKEPYYLFEDKIILLGWEYRLAILKDERVDFIPCVNYLILKQKCEDAIYEITHGETTYLTKEDYKYWVKKHDEFYERVRWIVDYEKFIKFKMLHFHLWDICINERQNMDSEIALNEFNKISINNDKELLNWLVKNEDLGVEINMVNHGKWDEAKKISGYYKISESPDIFISGNDIRNSVKLSEIFDAYYWKLCDKYATIEFEEMIKCKNGSEEMENYLSLTYHLKKRGMIDAKGIVI
jgi:hypothetical protein